VAFSRYKGVTKLIKILSMSSPHFMYLPTPLSFIFRAQIVNFQPHRKNLYAKLTFRLAIILKMTKSNRHSKLVHAQ